MNFIIKSALLLNPGHGFNGEKVDVQIKNGKIENIGTDLSDDKAEVINAENCILSMGYADLRSSFCDPGLEHKETLASGREAAVSGGFTHVMVIPDTNPPIQSKNDVNYILSGNKSSLVQLYPMVAVTLGLKGEELTEMLDLNNAGAKVFGDGDHPVWNTDILVKSLQYLQKVDGLLVNKPCDQWLSKFGQMHEGKVSTSLGMKGIPVLAETLMINRDIELLRYAGGKLHFSTISSKESVEIIREAKKDGLNISCDVAVHNLLYTDEENVSFDSNYKVDPPLRSEEDRKALVEGVKDGTIDCIVTDHHPHDPESKNLEYDLADFGITGLQTAISQLWQIKEEIGEERLIDAITIQPRRLMSVENTGLEIGAVADLTIFDPNFEWEFDDASNKSLSKNSPLFNTLVKGKVRTVIFGKQIYQA
ncbi:dihydroorotase [Marinigracilibium pacificum]|uniref:Dihydroorotase n=1 Tax=Marinigracilibium pacificum TaxID=2729599 RepID=A0A848JB63_9BACT|nr:dihydroorotase [Marinigracilibium pacificum]NMM50272.1 dihydroorotase [Marinigracilibium pacificum]